MRKNKTKQRITTMVLSVIMVVGMMQVSALAETGTFPIGTSDEITSFEALGSDIAIRSVPLGTSETDLELPNTLTAMVRLTALEKEPVLDSEETDSNSADTVNGSVISIDKTDDTETDEEAEIASSPDAEEAGSSFVADSSEKTVDSTDVIVIPLPVTWTSSPEYNDEAVGTYVFTPELPEGLTLTNGVEFPIITVTVSEVEAPPLAARGMFTLLPTGREKQETVQGLGTEEDPLRIETAAQLAAFSWSVNHGSLPVNLPDHPYLILVNDINLTDYSEEDYHGKGWIPIGGYYNENENVYAFNGIFDGNNKTIRGLYIYRSELYVGLFGYIKEGAVKNLTVEGGNVTGYAATGGIVGFFDNGLVENCNFSGSVSGEEGIGGIVGNLLDSQLKDCVNTGSIIGKVFTGGIVGSAVNSSGDGSIENCVNTGEVTGSEAFTGGVAGAMDMLADYCVNTGTVKGGTAMYTGGVAGKVFEEGIIQNCVNTGIVQGGTGMNTGGVAGEVFEGIIQNCVNSGGVSGNANNIGGVAGFVDTGTIQNCVNYADISSYANSVGGVAGFVKGGSVVTNCLTTGNISGNVTKIERGGVSGVVGYLNGGNFSNRNTISGCVALGQSVTKDGEMGNVARIATTEPFDMTYENFAWSGMQLWYDDEPISEEEYSLGDGENADAATLQTLWTAGALAESWSDAGVWTLAEGKLPVLTDLPHQSDKFPSHISGITGVTVSPDSTSVQKGTMKGFTATVTGIGAIDDTVTWSVCGAARAGTAIDFSGMLTVAADETAATLIVTATATGDSSKKSTASVTVTDPPVVKYALTVNSGFGSGEYAEGANVTITAAAPAEDKLFDKWIVTSGTLDLSDATANPITITMLAEAIVIEATYKDKPADSDPTYIVTLSGGGSGVTGAGSYAEGTAINIYAGTRSGYTFTGWTSPDVVIINAGNKNASFTMPGKAVTVTANWSYNGGSSGNDSGRGGSDDSTITIQPEKKPDQPVVSGFSVTPAVNGSGYATVTISQQSVVDAIAKAQTEAKAQGKTANGIGILLNIDLQDTAESLGIVLPQATLQSLVSSGVRKLEINGVIVSLDLDLEALKEIQQQGTGGVTITIKPVQNLSAAGKKLISKRPVYDVTISYVKDGKTVNITSLDRGNATLSFPYIPGNNEAVGYLFGVYVDGKGNATRIPGSAYDANSRSIIFSTDHFSVYGVGYTAPTEKYTDIANHWAKESIDYAVGRGLFSGTADTKFSPDIAMDRGMLVTVLGRLADADVSAYKTSSFSDVAAGKYYLPYMEWAYKKGIISGTGNGKSAPERAVTHEEIALILQNYAKVTGYKLPITREVISYADASNIGSVYKTAVTAMQQAGIMMGGNGNKFNPKTGATRAEVAAMFHRYIKLTIDPAAAQGWAKNDAGQYLYYQDGKPLAGWQTIGGGRYFFNTNGTLQTGWVKDGNNWRFYDSNRALVGWWDIGSETSKKRYYFDVNAIMVSGKWFQIDGKWYYFYADGSLAVSTKIDGYEVEENGIKKTE